MAESSFPRIQPEAAASLLLRLALGMLLFFAGLNKFLNPHGATAVSKGITESFADTWLPTVLVAPYAYVLPYVEVLVGAALILGLWSKLTFLVAGLLLVSLAFGKVVTMEYATVANNLNYVFMAAAGVYVASRDDRYSVTGLLAGRDRG